MYLSDEAANAALGALVGDDNTTGATLFFGLCETEPTISGGVITVTDEISGGGYARVAVANNGTKFTISNGVAENASEVAWPEATADWSEASWVFVATASTSGTILWYGELSGAPVTVTAGVTLRLPAGTATITTS